MNSIRTVRISDKLFTEIEQEARALEQSRSDIIRTALREHFTKQVTV